jgi:hypothetical protein
MVLLLGAAERLIAWVGRSSKIRDQAEKDGLTVV